MHLIAVTMSVFWAKRTSRLIVALSAYDPNPTYTSRAVIQGP
jgi:hypothetical protein